MVNDIEKRTHPVPGRIRRGMRLSVLEGAFSTSFIVLTSGAFLTGYALMLGADDFEIGLLVAIPYLAQFSQIFGAYVIELTAARKSVAVVTLTTGRLFYIFLVFLPFTVFLGGTKVALLLFVIAAASVLVMAGVNAWTSWMGDFIPEQFRGRYFGTRNRYLTIVTILFSLAGGKFLDWFMNNGAEKEGFAWLFGAGVLFALIAFLFLALQPSAPVQRARTGKLWGLLALPLKNRNYRRMLVFFVVFYCGVGFSIPFFNPHMLKNLSMSYFEIAVFSVIISITSFAAYRYWGIAIDRAGNRPVMIICTVIIVTIPLFWLSPQPGIVWPVWLLGVLTGIGWSGFNLAAFNMPIVLSPRENRSFYLAVYSVATGMTIFTASTVAGLVADSLSGMKFTVNSFKLVNYHIIFLISAVIRLSSLVFVRNVEETRDVGVPVLLQFMGRAAAHKLSSGGILFPYRYAKRFVGSVKNVVTGGDGYSEP
jgi:MFS family permease